MSEIKCSRQHEQFTVFRDLNEEGNLEVSNQIYIANSVSVLYLHSAVQFINTKVLTLMSLTIYIMSTGWILSSYIQHFHELQN